MLAEAPPPICACTLLDAAVYNDKGEKIGSIDDIIVSPKRTVSHAIVGVGGFLGRQWPRTDTFRGGPWP
jgi:sporulation protein YlmC with PRC-barrel domain